MPDYLPARLGIQYSEAIAESMASATVGDPILLTLELHHSAFLDSDGNPTAARVVNDFRDLSATLEDDAPLNAGEVVLFTGVPFQYTKPEQTDSGAPAAVVIEIDNVSRRITQLLTQALESQEPILVIEREYMSSDTSAPHVLPPTRLYLGPEIEITSTTVRAQASFGDMTNRRFPVDEYVREKFAALAAT